jgi:hypothetical protein
MIPTAANLLGVKENTLEEFDTIDLYNDNRIQGVLCKQANENYGALVIFKVNGQDTHPQVIYCTPKLHYPFGTDINGERQYNFPETKKIFILEKLDGTNICAYTYIDANNKSFITYKTRLTPTLRESKWGDFKSMWDEILKKYPKEIDNIHYFMSVSNVGFSFEMYGYRNPILVKYKEPIDAKALFAVSQLDASIIPACDFSTDDFFLQPKEALKKGKDVIERYNELRDESDAHNKECDDGIEGIEGYIFYCMDKNDKWSMLKCKPSMIENLHWVGDSIPYNSIVTTCWNALESCEALTVEYITELLREDFSNDTIGKSEQRIHKAVEYVILEHQFRTDVRVKYLKSGLDYERDGKVAIMKYMSQHFSRDRMSKVYGALKILGLIK